MNLVIDANVFRAFYEEEVLGYPPPRPGRTASPASIFASLSKGAFTYIDSGQQIEHEWRNVCKGGEEWFDGWLAEAFATGGVTPLEINNKRIVEQQYRKIGFPFKGRDIWYVRVSVSLSSACSTNNAYLVSEDIDFFDPALKKDAHREKCIQNGTGPVAKQLKKDGVMACCIKCFLENLA